jgi:hypothetical protein
MPPDVRWRFIGHLQSNKAKPLCAGVPNLVAVETVDSAKLATLLNTAWAPHAAAQGARRLDVYVQVNTSGEETKHGVEPADALALARHVAEACPHLRLSGLMTIGQPDYTSRPENFTTLAKCRDEARPPPRGCAMAPLASLTALVACRCARLWGCPPARWSCPWACQATLRRPSRWAAPTCAWVRPSLVRAIAG